MKLIYVWVAAIIISAMAFTGCKKEDNPKPVKARVTMDSGTENPPQPPPHP